MNLSVQAAPKRFNANLLVVITVLVLLIGIRLWVAALEQENFRGFFLSITHVLIVAVGSYFSVRRA
jgi:hypothetical protein